jgi:hypothetical protein
VTDTLEILATGSRQFGNPGRIRDAFTILAASNPGTPIRLTHGQCDPRHPVSGGRIPWPAALKLAPARQLELLSADWLCDRIAEDLGWEIRRVPADWAHRPRWAAGPERNGAMVGDGPYGMCLAWLAAGEENRGTLDCSVKAWRAGISVIFYCGMCPAPRLYPCRVHMLETVPLAWDAATKRKAPRAQQAELPL